MSSVFSHHFGFNQLLMNGKGGGDLIPQLHPLIRSSLLRSLNQSEVCPDPSSWTLTVSDPQVVDLGLVAVGDGASEDQRVVGQSEGVAAAGVSHRRKTSGCRRKNNRKHLKTQTGAEFWTPLLFFSFLWLIAAVASSCRG